MVIWGEAIITPIFAFLWNVIFLLIMSLQKKENDNTYKGYGNTVLAITTEIRTLLDSAGLWQCHCSCFARVLIQDGVALVWRHLAFSSIAHSQMQKINFAFIESKEFYFKVNSITTIYQRRRFKSIQISTLLFFSCYWFFIFRQINFEHTNFGPLLPGYFLVWF